MQPSGQLQCQWGIGLQCEWPALPAMGNFRDTFALIGQITLGAKKFQDMCAFHATIVSASYEELMTVRRLATL
jgi:hypothetical protein